MRCGRCGNENAETNRFCGMCGASLIAPTTAGGQKPAAPAGDFAAYKQAAAPVAPVPRTPPAARDSGPSPGAGLAVPSILGLSTPGPHVDRHADGDADVGRDGLRPSSNLDYLLEDEEQPKSGGGKLILVVVALALAVGFGYLHWKHGGFDWLDGGEKKSAAAAKLGADAAPSGTDGGGAATTPEGATAAGTTPAASTPGESVGATAPSAAAPAPANSAAVSPATSSGNSSTPSSAAPSTPSSTPSATASQDASQTASQPAPSQSTPSPSDRSAGQAADPNLPAVSAPQVAGADSGQQPPAAARKPSPARTVVVRPVDPVTEAERYIYGRGVRQDCDRGLRLLKAPAQQFNAKAMTSLGALYSTGTCTPRDLPTAYRWFALALHRDPDNQALQGDLQKLWAQMTQPERQLAIKLSQ